MAPDKTESRVRARKVLDIILVIVLVIFICFNVALLVSYIRLSWHHNKDQKQKADLCETKECLATAAQIRMAMNDSHDPCVDFYLYACGGWMNGSVPQRSMVGVRSLEGLLMQQFSVMQNLLAAPSHDGELKAVSLAKTFYHSCQDDKELQNQDLAPFKKIFSQLKERVADKSLVTDDLAAFLLKVGELDLYPLVDFGIQPDKKNTTVNMIYLEQPHLNVERYLYFFPKFEQFYTNLVMKAMNIVDPDPDWSSPARAGRIVQFEMRLANITLTPEEVRDQKMDYSPTTAERLTYSYSSFNWSAFLTGVFRNAEVEVELSPTENIVMSHQRYYDRLFPLLLATPVDTVVDFVVWSFVMAYKVTLPPVLRKIFLEYRTQYLGVERAQLSRQHVCVTVTSTTMPQVVSRVYIDSNFSPATIAATKEMVSDTLRTLMVLLGSLEWMTSETRERAMNKVRKMGAEVGFSKEEISDEVLDSYYQGVVMSNKTFLENFLTMRRFIVKKGLSQLRKPVRVKWVSPASEVNAFYLPTNNRIFLPAGILQYPMFSLNNVTLALNYGTLGTIIGHEILHGFDDIGMHFDDSGNMKDWWQHSDKENFQEKKDCLVHQYSNFLDKELNLRINGKLTLGENIADNGGLKIAFQTFVHYLREHNLQDHPVSYPGLQSFTQAQLFFLAYAQSWCSDRKATERLIQMHVDVHTLNHFRVLGTLQNSADFANTFSCSLASPMNPTHKCLVW